MEMIENNIDIIEECPPSLVVDINETIGCMTYITYSSNTKLKDIVSNLYETIQTNVLWGVSSDSKDDILNTLNKEYGEDVSKIIDFVFHNNLTYFAIA